MDTEYSPTFDAVELAGDKAKYDENAKMLLGLKEVVARIVKAVVTEFKDCSLDEIESSIEAGPYISSVPVAPGLTGPAISGLQSENSIPNEGTVTFDVLTFIRKRGGTPIKLYIDIEAQNAFEPGYNLITRAIYYCTRLISSQKNREFEHSEYDKIKKVYSIWICTSVPDDLQGCIVRYAINEELVAGRASPNQRYDLFEVYLIGLGEPCDETAPEINQILSTLFSDSMSTAEKEKILSEKFEFRSNHERKELLEHMCNLSEGIERRGIERGMARGMEQGIARGMEQGMARGIARGMEQGGKKKSLEIARNLLSEGISRDIVKRTVPGITNEELSAILADVRKQ